MLEALFARQAQQQAFLWMLAGGLALGLMLQAGQALRRHAVLSAVWDGVCAASLLALLLRVFLLALGARAYAVLGLLLGLLLWMLGPGALLRLLGQKVCIRRGKEGFRTPDAEYHIHASPPHEGRGGSDAKG